MQAIETPCLLSALGRGRVLLGEPCGASVAFRPRVRPSLCLLRRQRNLTPYRETCSPSPRSAVSDSIPPQPASESGSSFSSSSPARAPPASRPGGTAARPSFSFFPSSAHPFFSISRQSQQLLSRTASLSAVAFSSMPRRSSLLLSLSPQAASSESALCPAALGQQRRSLVEVKFAQQRAKDTSHVPFKVVRTPSGNLPVYSRVKKHGTEVTTIVRHAFGDITAMKKDLMAICEAPVRERLGTLEVKGLHVLKIKQWLRSLGF
ncbi:large subunit ribosomal protein IMG2 [Besnoitia besnoiti]|uniref:Large ribosomal subunit protein mL49 n=1 Tax=Besnoitia besnoiti TaxID=94643 RepID=A0A2A9MQM0_BESBE|nr:large subunit ribosomal protein IMG2 [Besnoitia besnoiti]PFH38332.1 large subunit ribosomal protein IMG2 [Besnoitia besnoiti]